MKILFIIISLFSFNLKADFLEQDIILSKEQSIQNLSKLINDTSEYDKVFNEVRGLFEEEIHHQGATLSLKLRWDYQTINASAAREDNNWIINFNGGMLRHKSFNIFIFKTVLCHELGHHLAGHPFKFPTNPDRSWVSAEGQSDYFATKVCLNKLFEHKDNKKFLQNKKISTTAKNSCNQSFNNSHDQDKCERTAFYSLITAKFIRTIGRTKRGHRHPIPRFESPDQTIVTKTFVKHPAPQCRLDTYFQGSLCNQDICTQEQLGARPKCWFFD